jgi:hypothetical protein
MTTGLTGEVTWMPMMMMMMMPMIWRWRTRAPARTRGGGRCPAWRPPAITATFRACLRGEQGGTGDPRAFQYDFGWVLSGGKGVAMAWLSSAGVDSKIVCGTESSCMQGERLRVSFAWVGGGRDPKPAATEAPPVAVMDYDDDDDDDDGDDDDLDSLEAELAAEYGQHNDHHAAVADGHDDYDHDDDDLDSLEAELAIEYGQHDHAAAAPGNGHDDHHDDDDDDPLPAAPFTSAEEAGQWLLELANDPDHEAAERRLCEALLLRVMAKGIRDELRKANNEEERRGE